MQVTATILDSAVTSTGGALRVAATDGAVITSIVLAGSVAFGASGSGAAAFGGAGVYAENTIRVDVRAVIDGDTASTGTRTTITAQSVSVRATDTSVIMSIAGAASVAAAFSADAAAAISIGVAIALNQVANVVEASISSATVTANGTTTGTTPDGTPDGGITVAADETASILSLTAAASLAAAAALYVGVAVSGAGAFASNVVTTATNALVEDSTLTAKRAISVTADDTSSIQALIAAISAAIGAGVAGIGVSIGLSLARNVIGGTRTVTAADFRSNEVANLVGGGTPSTVRVTSGHVSPDLQSNDGDGTTADDVYLLPGLIVRIVDDATVGLPSGTSQGQLYRYVGSFRRANLDSMSYGSSDWVLVGGAPGAVYAWTGATTTGVDLNRENFLDTARWRLVSADHTSGDTLTTGTLQAGDTVFIVAGPGAGDVYSYVGPDRTATTSAPIAFQTEDFRNASAWKLANLASTPAQVRARLVNTSVAGDGSLTLQATAQPTIEAIVVAASVAVSGGGVGFALSGAGAVTLNSIAMQVEATITGDGVVHDPTSQNPVPAVRATSVTLRATDTATIRAVTGAASIAVALGAGSVALAISIAAAVNTIDNEVTAGIIGADDTVKATNGGITIAALEDATIEAISAAAAVAVGCCGTASITISGAGALAINTILTKVNATIAASDVVATGNVDLDAGMTGSIRAIIVAVAAAVSISAGGLAFGAALGASLAWNLIGTDVSGNDRPAEVRAVISDSSVDAGGAITADAVSSATIEAIVVAVAVALSIGGVGVGLAGAGSSAINTISTLVEASIGDSDDPGTDGDGATGVKAASISLTATDSSRIDAITGAASIAGAFGAGGIALAISVSYAQNTIDTTVLAAIVGADTLVDAGAGGVALLAQQTGAIRAITAAAAIAASVGLASALVLRRRGGGAQPHRLGRRGPHRREQRRLRRRCLRHGTLHR